MASTQSGFDDSVQANAMRSQNPMCGGSDLTCQSPEGTAGQRVLYLNPEAQFLSLVRFPQIWVPRWENRDLRQLLQHRHRIVEARTRITSLLDEASQALPEAWATPSQITTCVSHLSPNVRCQIGLPNHSGIFDNEHCTCHRVGNHRRWGCNRIPRSRRWCFCNPYEVVERPLW